MTMKGDETGPKRETKTGGGEIENHDSVLDAVVKIFRRTEERGRRAWHGPRHHDNSVFKK